MAKPLQKIMQYVGQHGIVRPRDIEAIGLPREYLVRLHRQGRLSRPGRGIYTLPDANVTERHSYAEVAKRVPEAVICLLSALSSKRSPLRVLLRFGSLSVKGRERLFSLRLPSGSSAVSGPSLTQGIENHQVEGVTFRVYSPAKTVADCFKFRNKIGLDVAIEALKDSLRQKKANVNEIYRYAKVCRVSNVIRPYMEAL